MWVYAVIETGKHLAESPRLVEVTQSVARADIVKHRTLKAAAENAGFDRHTLSHFSMNALENICAPKGIRVTVCKSFMESE